MAAAEDMFLAAWIGVARRVRVTGDGDVRFRRGSGFGRERVRRRRRGGDRCMDGVRGVGRVYEGSWVAGELRLMVGWIADAYI